MSRLTTHINKNFDNIIANIEENGRNRKRLDFCVRYKDTKEIICTGEFKKPLRYKSAMNRELVKDAFDKCLSFDKIPRFWITSIFTETLIHDNSKIDRGFDRRNIKLIKSHIKIRRDSDFDREDVMVALEEHIISVIQYILDIKKGLRKRTLKPDAVSFINTLNYHCEIITDVAHRYVKRDVLVKWWDDQQYAPFVKMDERHKRRMVQYTLYVLVNKIVFYCVIKKKYNLPNINYDKDSIIGLKNSLFNAFEHAENVTQCFSSIFKIRDEENILFEDDVQLSSLKNLVSYLLEYEFDKLEQDALGNIYDRLISPEQKKKFGQYYTDIPIVNLMNALAIEKSTDVVMDVSSGSGTFLVKGFDLKLKLNKVDNLNERERILSELYGIDIANYPCHIAQVSLASKLLPSLSKYTYPNIFPNIINKDFFDVANTNSATGGIGKVDCVVGNLPYVRQEHIDKMNLKSEHFYFNSIKGLTQENLPNKKADFHIYFWYKILPFLKEGSRVCLLTSDAWLNVEYGQNFKKYLNDNFKITLIMESSCDSWFDNVLVNTCITLIERCSNKQERDSNEIKFIKVHKKISDLIPDIDSAIKIANSLKKGISSDDVEIVTTVKQLDIDFDDILKSKFFPYLRGDNVFFELVDKIHHNIDSFLDVGFSIKTGANDYFHGVDITDEIDKDELYERFNIRCNEHLRIIKNGLGECHIIEEEYLMPLIKSPREFDSIEFYKKPKKVVLFIKDNNKKTLPLHVKRYIEHGEDMYIHKRPSCISRKPWWKLPNIKCDISFPVQLYIKYVYPLTDNSSLIDAKLMNGNEKQLGYKDIVHTFMNSSLSYLYPDLYGRTYAGGSTNFTVYELKHLPIPKINVNKKLKYAIFKLGQRKIGTVFQEIWDGEGVFSLDKVKEDRLELDREILRQIGYKNPDDFLLRWYPVVIRVVRERVKKAENIKIKSDEKFVIDEVVAEIYDNIKDKAKIFPDDYVISDTTLSFTDGKMERGVEMDGWITELEGGKKYVITQHNSKLCCYLSYCSRIGKIKNVPIPTDSGRILLEFKHDVKKLLRSINKEIDEMPGSNEYDEKIKNNLLVIFRLDKLTKLIQNIETELENE